MKASIGFRTQANVPDARRLRPLAGPKRPMVLPAARFGRRALFRPGCALVDPALEQVNLERAQARPALGHLDVGIESRSEERRVGKECRL